MCSGLLLNEYLAVTGGYMKQAKRRKAVCEGMRENGGIEIRKAERKGREGRREVKDEEMSGERREGEGKKERNEKRKV